MKARRSNGTEHQGHLTTNHSAFLTAVDDFAEVAGALAEQWELASDAVGDAANEGYPFPNSFDEVAWSIRLWAENVRKAYSPAFMAKGTMTPKIVSCRIGPYPQPLPEGLSDSMPSVTVTFDDDTTKTLFTFYPDEISLAEREFIGLTEEEARQLRSKKDIAYLQS